jgi:hypothetical protein
LAPEGFMAFPNHHSAPAKAGIVHIDFIAADFVSSSVVYLFAVVLRF